MATTTWTTEEDDRLINVMSGLKSNPGRAGHPWAQIAKDFPGKTAGQIKNRWSSSLKNKLGNADAKQRRAVDENYNQKCKADNQARSQKSRDMETAKVAYEKALNLGEDDADDDNVDIKDRRFKDACRLLESAQKQQTLALAAQYKEQREAFCSQHTMHITIAKDQNDAILRLFELHNNNEPHTNAKRPGTATKTAISPPHTAHLGRWMGREEMASESSDSDECADSTEGARFGWAKIRSPTDIAIANGAKRLAFAPDPRHPLEFDD